MKRHIALFAGLVFVILAVVSAVNFVKAQEIWRAATDTYVMNITSSSAQASTSFETGVSAVRLMCNQDCFVAIGASPVSVDATGGIYLPSERPEVFRVNPGESVAVIEVGANDGNLYITELTR